MSRAVVVGLDAALVSASLGFMYALVTSSPVGKQALPMAMWGTLVGFIVGVAAMAGFWRGPRLMTTPNATGVLVLAAMLFELQTLPGMQGSVAAAVLAVSGTCLVYGLLQVLYGHAGVGAAMKFLPFPVISGFTNTVALSLVVSMLPSALGHDYLGRLLKAPTWFTDVRPGALVVAAAGLLAMRPAVLVLAPASPVVRVTARALPMHASRTARPQEPAPTPHGPATLHHSASTEPAQAARH